MWCNKTYIYVSDTQVDSWYCNEKCYFSYKTSADNDTYSKILILIINLLVNNEMESAEKVYMPKLVHKVNAPKKFQLSHNGRDVIIFSSFNWWINLDGSWYSLCKSQIFQVQACTVPHTSSCQWWGNETSKEDDEIQNSYRQHFNCFFFENVNC